MPLLREKMAPHSAAHIAEVFEKNGLPFAPIARPQDLLEDPHLNATGALAPITLPDGRETKTVLLPFTLDGKRLMCACRPRAWANTAWKSSPPWATAASRPWPWPGATPPTATPRLPTEVRLSH
jgi:hypothetical protein